MFSNNDQRLEAILVSCIDLSAAMRTDCWSCKICYKTGEDPGFTHYKTCPVKALGRDWTLAAHSAHGIQD